MKMNSSLFIAVSIFAAISSALCQEDLGINPIGSLYHYWGTSQAVTLHDNHAFVATQFTGLSILDVSNPREPIEVGHWCADWNPRAISVAVSGNLCLLGTLESNLFILDISEVSSPQFINYYGTGGYVSDIAVRGNYCYLAISNTPVAFQVLDIEDPANPELIGSLESDVALSRCIALSGQHAFLGSRFGLLAIDITEPQNPRQVGTCEIEGYLEDIATDGQFCYLANLWGGVNIVNIEDPENLFEVASIETPDPAWAITQIGDNIFVADSSGVVRIDVSDPVHPNINGSWGGAFFARDVAVSENIAFVVDFPQITVIEAGDPDSLTKIGSFSAIGRVVDVAVSEGIAYIADAGLRIVNVANPEMPRELGYFPIEGYFAKLSYFDGHCYFSGGNTGVKILDVTDPTDPILVMESDRMVAREVVADGEYCYVASGDSGFHIVDITDFQNPELVASCDTFGNVRSVRLKGEVCFLGAGRYLHLLDVSNPESPQHMGRLLTSTGINHMEIEGDYCYIVSDWIGVDEMLCIIDISNPESPREVGLWEVRFSRILDMTDLTIVGNYCVVSSSRVGIHVFDVSDPESPIEIGYFRTPGWAEAVAVDCSIVYVADRSSFGIYDCSDVLTAPIETTSPPTSFLLHPAFPNPFNASTTITYDVARPGFVRLGVYDAVGRLVGTVKEGYAEPGSYRETWKGAGVASGRYLLKLEAENTQLSKPIYLLR